jgi:hypothetical protein
LDVEGLVGEIQSVHLCEVPFLDEFLEEFFAGLLL